MTVSVDELKASPEVVQAVEIVRAEIGRIWEPAWQFAYKAWIDGVNDDFYKTLNSNPVLASLFFEMEHTAHIWKQAGLSVDQIPPAYSVKRTKLESLFIEVVDK